MSSTTHSLDVLAQPERHLFFSPHYDDVPLSAGGVVRTLADLGRHPETLVIFGAEPAQDQELTAFATGMHEQWGLDASQVIASRQAEERVASSHLGATVRILPFRDAIYREDYYLSNEDLFGTPHPAEADVPREIIAALNLPATPDPGIRFYAPLAIGNHVDHQHAFDAAVMLAGSGWDVWFYEDAPYSLKTAALEARLDDVASTTPVAPVALVPVSGAWEAKIDAIMSYPSQLDTVFRVYVGISPKRLEIDRALQERAVRVGDGTLVERFWKVNESR